MAKEKSGKGKEHEDAKKGTQIDKDNKPNVAREMGTPVDIAQGNNPNDESQTGNPKEIKSDKGDRVQRSKEKFSKEAESIFKDYPKTNELYFTSDGLAFFEKTDAENHARSLKESEREIVEVKKSDKK